MLSDLRILIVEDEDLVAMDLSMIVEELGGAVVRQCSTVEEALQAVAEPVDAAILDVELEDDMIFPVADRLREQGKPFVFHTGRYAEDTLQALYGQHVPVVIKPAQDHMIVEALAQASRRSLH